MVKNRFYSLLKKYAPQTLENERDRMKYVFELIREKVKGEKNEDLEEYKKKTFVNRPNETSKI